MDRPGDAERRPWWPLEDAERTDRKKERDKETGRTDSEGSEKSGDNKSPDQSKDTDTVWLESQPSPDLQPDGGPEKPRLERTREELAVTLAKLPPELRYRFEAAISQEGGEWSFERGRFMYMYVIRAETLQTESGPITVKERLTLRRDRPIRILSPRERQQLAESVADPGPDADESEPAVELKRQTSSYDRIEVTGSEGPTMAFEIPVNKKTPDGEAPPRFRRIKVEAQPDPRADIDQAEVTDTAKEAEPVESPAAVESAEREFPRLSMEELEELIESAYRDTEAPPEPDQPPEVGPAVPPESLETGDDQPVPHEDTASESPTQHERDPSESDDAADPRLASPSEIPDEPQRIEARKTERPTGGQGFDRLMMEVVVALDEKTSLPPIAGGSPELDRQDLPRRPRRPRPNELEHRAEPAERPRSITESAIRPSRAAEGRLLDWERRHRRPEDPPDSELRRKARKLARVLARRYGLRLTPEMEIKLMEAILTPRIINGHEVFGLGLNREHVLDVIRTLWLHYPEAAPRIKPDVY